LSVLGKTASGKFKFSVALPGGTGPFPAMQFGKKFASPDLTRLKSGGGVVYDDEELPPRGSIDGRL
jgi:hypothetical protein